MSGRWRWRGGARGGSAGRRCARRRRSALPGAALAGVVGAIGALAAPAVAQSLDIRPTETPEGAWSSVAMARQDLADELEELTGAGEAAAADPASAAEIALRRYALALLPEEAPPASLALLGRTLWRLTPALDDALDAASDAERAHVAALLRDAPAPLTAEDAERLLRDALAPLAQAGGEVAGWFDAAAEARPGGELATPLLEAELGAAEDTGPEGVISARLVAMERELLAEADRWRAYRRSSAAIRSWLWRGAAAAAAELPWADEVTLAALTDAFRAAALRLTSEDEDPAQQLASLEGLVRARAFLQIAGDLPEEQWQRARTAAQVAVAHDPTMRARGLRDAAATLGRIATMLPGAGAPEATDERRVIRHLRPAWRALIRQRDEAAETLSDVAPDLLGAGRPVTDPGALAAIAALEQLNADLRGVQAISRLVADPASADAREPVAARERRLMAGRLLRLGQAMQEDGPEAEAALRELRQFAAIVRAREGAPTAAWVESQPDAVARAWREMGGGRAMELLATDARVLETWLSIWPDTNDATRLRELEQRLRAHALLFAPLVDLAEARAMMEQAQPAHDPASELRISAPGHAPRWPGWELSQAAMGALLARAEARAAETVAMALDRRGTAPAQRAAALAAELAPLRLVVALEQRMAGAGAPAPGPLDEVALGPPLPGSLLAEAREQLAGAALALEDWAISLEADESLWERAGRLAERALRAIGEGG